MAYTVGIALALLSFQMVPASASALQWVNVFLIGFFLYGPQMLIGLCGAELVRALRHAAAPCCAACLPAPRTLRRPGQLRPGQQLPALAPLPAPR
jgi:hypothetical protein